MSPRQIIVCPVGERQHAYAEEVAKIFHDSGFYADSDLTDKTLPKKVRDAQLAQYNYIMVVGDKEVEERTVSVRTRDNVVHGSRNIPELISEFHQLAKEFK